MTTPAQRLSIEQRIGQVNQRLKGWEAVQWVDGAPRVTDVLRREVDRWGGLGALYGVLRADPWSGVKWDNGIPPERSAEAYAAVQDYVVTHGDGTPTLFCEEAPHGIQALGATTLPLNLALGAGMDADLAEELAELVAGELRDRGAHVALVSGLDVLRDPRWGRAEECFSEDPALAAALVAATVRGMQGTALPARAPEPSAAADRQSSIAPTPSLPAGSRPIDSRHVAMVAKHFAGQGDGIGGRNGSGAPIGPREFGEIHLRPAYAAVRAGVAGVMAAYNDVDGVPCCGNRDLLTGTLREEWGWDGIVMADGGAIDRLTGCTPGIADAAALALSSGVDVSLWDEAYAHLPEAIERGLVDEDTLTRAADRVLALKRRVGLSGGVLEEQAAGPAPVRVTVGDRAALGLKAAREAIVPLTNRGVLPLAADGTIALVGPNADDVYAQCGDYTPPRPEPDPEASTVRSALVARLGADRVRYAQGSGRLGSVDGGLDDVRGVCRGADVCVAVLGGSSERSYADEFADNGAVQAVSLETTNGEGVDLAEVGLPAVQLDVVRTACETGLPVVAVVIDGRPRVLSELFELADAALFVPFPGPRGGEAIARALLDPALVLGRLPASLPAADGVMPVAHDERIESARGYLGHPVPAGEPLGSADLSGVGMELGLDERAACAEHLRVGGTIPVRVAVTNTRTTPIDLPVVLYGRRHQVGLTPRRRMLLGVRRVALAAGERATVEFELGLDELGSWETGSPVARTADIDVWCTQEPDPPTSAARIAVRE